MVVILSTCESFIHLCNYNEKRFRKNENYSSLSAANFSSNLNKFKVTMAVGLVPLYDNYKKIQKKFYSKKIFKPIKMSKFCYIARTNP